MARILIIMLVAAVVGGGAVYGAMLYLDRNPVQLEVPVLGSLPSSDRVPTATTGPLQSPLLVPPTSAPAATVAASAVLSAAAPAATVTPTPASAPTEREIVVNAFGECAGQYSGANKRFRMRAADGAIANGRQTVADVRGLVEEHCDGVFPQLSAAAPPLSATSPAETASAGTQNATATPKPTDTPRPTDTPQLVAALSPDLRHIEEKRYMLDLINSERKKAGVAPVVLGDNIAAQLHGEASLENCFSGHWGVDGLKPYMRYSLAGGFQSNGENGSGLDYCIRAADRYRPIASMDQEIREAMEGWMDSPGHRRNILDPQHKRVNIGIAWDRYNTAMYQHFEGGYVEYDRLPMISDGILALSGQPKNGVRFRQERDLGLQIYYDPPPSTLTRGQLARTYCYDHGRLVAGLREPLTGGYRWTTHEFTTTYDPCPSPYDVAADTPAPRSPAEAHRAWQQAYNASQSRQPQSITIPWITAKEWKARDASFAVHADISKILSQHGHGVYTVMLWGDIDGARAVISQYSMFHGATPPDTYRLAPR